MPTQPAAPQLGPAQHSQYRRESLVPFLNWILPRHAQHGGVTEIRLIADAPVKGVWSGYFDPEHVQELVAAIRPLPGGPRPKTPYADHPRIGEANIYFTMQAVNPALRARSADGFRRCQATSDADIVAYDLFAADVDPVRPSGISATDDEKREALKVLRAVVGWFKERGIEVVLADSGNGYHLLVPTTPYEDVAAASADARTLLQLLDKKVSTDKAKIDTTIYNPGRILKLYGTMSVKGSDLAERPHRFARVDLRRIPNDVDLFAVLKEELDAFRHDSQPTPKPAPAKKAAPAAPARRASPAAGSRGGWDADTSNKVLNTVLEKSGLPYRVKKKGDDTFYEFHACPHHTDPDGHTYECCVIVRGDGSYAAKCQHDGEAGWKDFKPLIGWAEHIAAVTEELGLSSHSVPYKMTPRGLIWLKPTKEGPIAVPLTNFGARIITDVAEDDGVEVRHTFELEATLGGRTVRFAVPAQQFGVMAWPLEHLGARAIVAPGQGARDHARAAIQHLSEGVATQTVYTHTGWRRCDGRWLYLHAGGAIGEGGAAPGVRVGLRDTLAGYQLPDPPKGPELVRAVRASLRMLRVAPWVVTVPLFASIWRAAFGGVDFSEFLVGPTGEGKSELVALAQQHWGPALNARNLPAAWANTANANETLAFLAKDAVLVVDDFAPTGSSYDVQKMHREADRLLRGQGNSAGRGRLRADASLRPARPPRGLILATGEDVPRGQSLRARIWVAEVAPGMVDWDRLTACQREAADGLYAAALAGFLRWLAAAYDSFRRTMPAYVRDARARASSSEQHRRTPDTVANLYFGLSLFGTFAQDAGALTEAQANYLWERGWAVLGEGAAAQRHLQAQSDPVERFRDLLVAALAAGKCHVAGAGGHCPVQAEPWGWRLRGDDTFAPLGDRVGWLDGDDLYLEPEAAFHVAQQFAQQGGEPLAVGSVTLRKRLHERGLLVQVDGHRDRLTYRRTLEGKSREVLWVRATLLAGEPGG